MTKEKSAGAIIFRIEKGEPLYLLLHYPSSAKAKEEYWDLAKGHIEKGEEERDTVLREIQEETGLSNVKLLPGFREEIHYWFQSGKQKISKTVVFYLVKTRQKEVAVSPEHIGFVWLPFQEAMQKLTFKNAKDVLDKAKKFLYKMYGF